MHFRFVVFFYLFIFLFSEDTYLRWPHVYIMLCVLCIEVLETDDEYYVFNTVGLVIYIHTHMYIRTKTVLRSYKWAHTYIYISYLYKDCYYYFHLQHDDSRLHNVDTAISNSILYIRIHTCICRFPYTMMIICVYLCRSSNKIGVHYYYIHRGGRCQGIIKTRIYKYIYIYVFIFTEKISNCRLAAVAQRYNYTVISLLFRRNGFALSSRMSRRNRPRV